MNRKLPWILVIVLVLAGGGLFAVKKLHLFAPKPAAPTVAGTDGNAPKERFLSVTAVTYHVENPLEIPIPDGEASTPRVSPDGARIVFVRTAGGKSEVLDGCGDRHRRFRDHCRD